jgi:LacI family transcriptional regulator
MGSGHLDEPAIRELVESGSPFVLFFGRSSVTNNHVTLDDSAGAKIAVNHLLGLGHRRIGCLSGPLIYDTSIRRLQGYRQALHEDGVPFDPALVEEGNWISWKDGRDSFKRLFKRSPNITGVFAATLTIAEGALMATREMGLSVPEDVSIVGFHDAPLTEITSPPLTVVKMPLYEMGYQAMSVLVEILNDQPKSVPSVMAGADLIIRESTTTPKWLDK